MSWAERAETTRIEGHSSLSERIIGMEDNFDYSSVLTGALAGINVTNKHRLASSTTHLHKSYRLHCIPHYRHKRRTQLCWYTQHCYHKETVPDIHQYLAVCMEILYYNSVLTGVLAQLIANTHIQSYQAQH